MTLRRSIISPSISSPVLRSQIAGPTIPTIGAIGPTRDPHTIVASNRDMLILKSWGSEADI